MSKGINLLELLFATFLTLHLAGIEPFNGWAWYFIAIPLIVEVIIRLFKRLWVAYGLDKLTYRVIEEARYDVQLTKATNRFKNDLKNGK